MTDPTKPLKSSVDARAQVDYDFAMALLDEYRDEIERLREIIKLPEPPDTGKTHGEGCWKDRGHHNCAVAEIERLRAEIEAHVCNRAHYEIDREPEQ